MLRTRIANGERMAGFKDLVTGHFNEVMIISKDEDIEEFMRRYGIASKNEIEGL
ncbi:MAG: aspartate dehydrogenase [Lachnospiraceae bacterium]|nr:aspartate dehydrogenase [Lachnospiraceae bacterium]